MGTKEYSFGRFTCGSEGLDLRGVIGLAAFDDQESSEDVPRPEGAVCCLSVPSEAGVWSASAVYDDWDDEKHPLEVLLHHEDQAVDRARELLDPRLLWVRTGRLIVIDSATARNGAVRQMYSSHVHRNDYVPFEHDRILESGLVVSMGSDVVVSVYIEQRAARTVGVRIKNPWLAILKQRLRNRVFEYFDLASADSMVVDEVVHGWDWIIPGEDPEDLFPEPAYSRTEREAILEFHQVWERSTGPRESALLSPSARTELRLAARKAFAVFRLRGRLPEDTVAPPPPSPGVIENPDPD